MSQIHTVNKLSDQKIYTISELPEEKFSFSKLLTPVSEEELGNYFGFFDGTLSKIVPYYESIGAFRYHNQIIYKYKEQSPWTVYYYYTSPISETFAKECPKLVENAYRPNWILEWNEKDDETENVILIAPKFKKEVIDGWLDNYKDIKWLEIFDTMTINDHVQIVSPIPQNGFYSNRDLTNPIM